MNGGKAWERGCRGRIFPRIYLSAGRLHSSNLGRTTRYEEIVGSIVVQAERFRDFATNQTEGKREDQEDAESSERSHWQ